MQQLNLYLVERDYDKDNDGYDTYDSFVAICESENAARKIHPCNGELKYIDELGYWEDKTGDSNSNYRKRGWVYGNQIHTHLEVTFLGEIYAQKSGLILASFNAG